jgi:hypothetical protein
MDGLLTIQEQRTRWVSTHVEDPRAAESKAEWRAYLAQVDVNDDRTPRERLKEVFA